MADENDTTPKYPGVQIQAKRDGRLYAYHRKTRTRLKTPVGTPEFAALLGHKTLAMATLYSAEANREQLGEAAIIRLNPRPKE